jgi:plasmid maintenance system antidote protein VapI
MPTPNIHIGNIIKQELKKQERSASWLARQINIEESTCRRMLQKATIDTYRLQCISIALKFDFFALISQNIRV